MRSHAGVANTMFRALADKAINIQVISTSEIKVSVLIAAEYTELAVRALHTAYGLDAADRPTPPDVVSDRDQHRRQLRPWQCPCRRRARRR